MLVDLLKNGERWARNSTLVRALYQGMPIVMAHRALSMIGVKGVLGNELAQMSRIAKIGCPTKKEERTRVLFVIPRNFRTHATFQTVLAQALVLRGAESAIVTCAETVPICEVAHPEEEVWPRCGRCTAYITELARLAGIRCFALSEYRQDTVEAAVSSEIAGLDVAQLSRYKWQDLALGKYAIAPTRWRLRSHHIEDHPLGLEVMRGFIRGGALWASAMRCVFDKYDPHVLVMLNGLFMEERVTWVLAKEGGRRCIFFEKGRDVETVFLSHDVSAPRYDVSSSWSAAKATPLNDDERRAVVTILDRRMRGEQLVEKYWDSRESDLEKICLQLGLRADVPLAVLFTNVVWDTAMQDRDIAFDGMLDWLRETIGQFRSHADWQLIIRIHPAETQVPGRESFDQVGVWMEREFSSLPSNIRCIPPHVPIDSYALMRLAQVGLVYASTVGLELSILGTPVVVAGAAHYSRKGFTADPSSKTEYHATVEQIMMGKRVMPHEEQIELALRYAHLFFLRRTLPIEILREPAEARPRLAYRSTEDLLPGRHRGIDIICDGILSGTEFELPRNSGNSPI
jgi:hypothetical protein